MNQTKIIRLSLLAVSSIALITNFILVRNDFNARLNTPHKGDFRAALRMPKDGTNKINPLKTVVQMKELYKHFETYKKLNGTIPCNFSGKLLSASMAESPKDYGFSNQIDAIKSLRNPDMAYSDSGDIYTNPYIFLCSRPNGEAITAQANANDVIAYTDMYFHTNKEKKLGQKINAEPSGFYVVLFGDGHVEQVPYDQVKYAKSSQVIPCFPNQAGASIDSLSFQEYISWLDRKIASR